MTAGAGVEAGMAQGTQGIPADVEPPQKDNSNASCRGLERPVFTVRLECPATLTLMEKFEVTVRVTYDGVLGISGQPPGTIMIAGARPVALHTLAVTNPYGLGGGFYAYRRRAGSIRWKECDLGDRDDTGPWGYSIANWPRVTERVAQDYSDDDADNSFVTLDPGKSWTTKRCMEDREWSILPLDALPGDVYRYAFHGAVVDWWDWGRKTLEHRDTVVTVLCVRDTVVEPQDNNGRPMVVMPSSETVEFTVMNADEDSEMLEDSTI
ncbi:hypothetical protein GGR55DRAFT_621180 [Xylaria sp. FL0064]|nr:hypothetical protein GGR55DRAFT_621180 [Xylaria sp. FL0064]